MTVFYKTFIFFQKCYKVRCLYSTIAGYSDFLKLRMLHNKWLQYARAATDQTAWKAY